MVIAFHYLLSSGCVKPGARHAIIQAFQQLGMRRFVQTRIELLKASWKGAMFLLACQRGLESRYASLCYPTRSITSVYKRVGSIVVHGHFTLDCINVSIGLFHLMRRRREIFDCRSFLMLSNFSCSAKYFLIESKHLVYK